MKGFIGAVLGVILFLAFVWASLVTGASGAGKTEEVIPFPDIPRMTKEQVKEVLGKAKIIIMDARAEEQWRLSDQMLPGAVHENPMDVKAWADKYSKDDVIIIY